jgi:hypothetical protein
MFVSCVCCVLSGSSLCVEMITRSEDSYRVGMLYHLETSTISWSGSELGCRATGGKKNIVKYSYKLSAWSRIYLLVLGSEIFMYAIN